MAQVQAVQADGLRYASAEGRWVLLATVLGSAVVMLDGTVVNVALPAIGRDLHAGIDGLQWTVSGYLLTLSALILLGGALGDRFGRRRVFVIGVTWFAAASLVCGIAPNLPALVAAREIDVFGASLAMLGLGGTTYALIEAPVQGPGSPIILLTGVGGLLALIAFFFVEARSSHPMLPLTLFKSRQFTATNLVTLAVYGALGAVFFLLILQLQQVVGYGPVQSGVATLPITALLLVISPRAGKLATRIGPRIPLTVGPLIAASGVALLARIGAGSTYLVDILPPLVLFGLGMSITVAPLTATVMGAVESRHAGLASAVNNAVARTAGLVAVAVLPPIAGLSGTAYLNPDVFSAGFSKAMLIAAGLTALGGVLGWITLKEGAPVAHEHTEEYCCALEAPPLRTRPVA